jgi:glycosyltransferase involved in cell wall biosynthesis
MVRALTQQSAGHRYLLVTGPEALPDALSAGHHVEQVALEAHHLMDEAWEQIALPTDLASRRTDVLFSPGSILPVARDFAAVPVVHDLGFLDHPEFYDEALRTYLTKWVEAACRTAEIVVCNSEFTRRRVMATYGLPAPACRAVYPGVDGAFTPDGPAGEWDRMERRYGLSQPYVLTVSSGGRNKNLPGATEAMSLLREDRGDPVPELVVVGPRPSGRTAAGAGGDDRSAGPGLKRVGTVPLGDLAALYRNAGAFLFPSLYEGFGMPPVEAMACGTPVVASNAAALPEVLGDAAALCDPDDSAGMAAALDRLLSDPEHRAAMARAGLQRSRRYSWPRSADALRDIFREAASGR